MIHLDMTTCIHTMKQSCIKVDIGMMIRVLARNFLHNAIGRYETRSLHTAIEMLCGKPG